MSTNQEEPAGKRLNSECVLTDFKLSRLLLCVQLKFIDLEVSPGKMLL